MLTSIPPALLHRVRDAAAYVHDLAQLGLALMCPCDDDHGTGARWLHDETAGAGMAESCYRPGCGGPVTGASDYCSPRCEWQTAGVKRCPQCGDVMDPDRAWWWTARGACCTEACARGLLAVSA